MEAGVPPARGFNGVRLSSFTKSIGVVIPCPFSPAHYKPPLSSAGCLGDDLVPVSTVRWRRSMNSSTMLVGADLHHLAILFNAFAFGKIWILRHEFYSLSIKSILWLWAALLRPVLHLSIEFNCISGLWEFPISCCGEYPEFPPPGSLLYGGFLHTGCRLFVPAQLLRGSPARRGTTLSALRSAPAGK